MKKQRESHGLLGAALPSTDITKSQRVNIFSSNPMVSVPEEATVATLILNMSLPFLKGGEVGGGRGGDF